MENETDILKKLEDYNNATHEERLHMEMEEQDALTIRLFANLYIARCKGRLEGIDMFSAELKKVELNLTT